MRGSASWQRPETRRFRRIPRTTLTIGVERGLGIRATPRLSGAENGGDLVVRAREYVVELGRGVPVGESDRLAFRATHEDQASDA